MQGLEIFQHRRPLHHQFDPAVEEDDGIGQGLHLAQGVEEAPDENFPQFGVLSPAHKLAGYHQHQRPSGRSGHRLRGCSLLRCFPSGDVQVNAVVPLLGPHCAPGLLRHAGHVVLGRLVVYDGRDRIVFVMRCGS